MHIVELTELQFKNYSNLHSKKNYKQSVEYGKLEEPKGYSKLFLALVDDNNNVHTATMILEKKLSGKFKYGYIPSGYLIDFYNFELLEIFTNELKSYLKKKNYIFLRLTPLINYQVYNSNFILKENNSSIINNLRSLGYNYLPNNSKYKMVLNINSIGNTFYTFKRSLRRNINDCLKKGISIHQGKSEEFEEFLKFVDNKDYYQQMAAIFNNSNNKFEFYFAKLNPETYVNNYRYLYKMEQIKNERLNNMLKNPRIKKTNNLLNKKMTSDSLLTKYHAEIIAGTNIYKLHPQGVIISTVAVISNKKEIVFVAEGYDKEFNNIRSTSMIKWEIIKKGLGNGYKTFDLGPIPINNNYTTKNGFNGNIVEYSNTFDLIINDMFYKLNNYAKKVSNND